MSIEGILLFLLGAAAMWAFLLGTSTGMRVSAWWYRTTFDRELYRDASDLVITAARILDSISSLLEDNIALLEDATLIESITKSLTAAMLEIRRAIQEAEQRAGGDDHAT